MIEYTSSWIAEIGGDKVKFSYKGFEQLDARDSDAAEQMAQTGIQGGKFTDCYHWTNRKKSITWEIQQPPINPFDFIKAIKFLRTYAPSVTNIKHKLRGKDGNGRSISFTEADKSAIRAGLDKLAADLLKAALIALFCVSCSKDVPPPPVDDREAAPARPRVDTAMAAPDFVAPGK